MMSVLLTPAQAINARRLDALGWTLIALSFAVAAGSAHGRVQGLANTFVASAAALIVSSCVAWLATRHRTAMAKAIARVVIGSLMLGSSSLAGVSSKHEIDVGNAFLRDSLALSERASGRFEALNAAFVGLDMAGILEPDKLITQPGREAGRRLIKDYRDLVTQRQHMLETNRAEVQALIAALPEGNVKVGAMRGAAESGNKMLRIYAKLDVSQRGHADALEKMLDWFEKNPNVTTTKGSLNFVTQGQADGFQRALDDLTRVEAEGDKTLQEVNVALAAAQEKQRKDIVRAKEMISR